VVDALTGGLSSQISNLSFEIGTTWFALAISRASTFRGLVADGTMDSEPTTASNGPRMLICISVPPRISGNIELSDVFQLCCWVPGSSESRRSVHRIAQRGPDGDQNSMIVAEISELPTSRHYRRLSDNRRGAGTGDEGITI
jgi:hypothetical protein